MPTATELLANMSDPSVLEMLCDDVEWHLPVSPWEGVRGAHIGSAAVREMLARVMNEFYEPETFSFEVLTAVGTESHTSMVCVVTAVTRWGQNYPNTYAIALESKDGKIARVHEVFDTKHLFDTMDDAELGIRRA